MENFKLENPSVKELIEALLKLDQDKKIIISDPDTGWDINIIHFSEYKGRVEMTGEYDEMNSSDKI